MTGWVRVAGALLAGAAMGSCGGKPPTDPSPSPTSTTITIVAAGTTPKSVQISIGSRVLFVNNDSRPHSINSDPHPDHTDCPEINQVGFLSPGQRRETGNFVNPHACGYHDHDDPTNASMQGIITIK